MNRLLAVLLLTACTLPAYAAGFDCSKASTRMERTICGDPGLSRVDEQLNQTYRQALAAASDKKKLMRAQKQWLNNTAESCFDPACLKAAYQSRMLQLAHPWQQTIAAPLSLPVPAPGFVGANQVPALITGDGTLWAWGENEQGQVGDGTRTSRNLPGRIGAGYAQVAPGGYYHMAALKTDGTLWGWGSGVLGQLGAGSPETPHKLGEHPPGAVYLGNGFVSAAAGQRYTFGLRSDGSLWQWGGLSLSAHGDVLGEIPDEPELLGTDFIAVAALEDHFAAIRKDGSLWMWGNNFDGQLGIGACGPGGCEQIGYLSKVGDGFAQVSVGYAHTAAIKKDGTLWVWGHNGVWGTIGNGTTEQRIFSPEQIGSGYTQVAAGFLNTAAIKSDGSLWLWGGNQNGLFGDCTNTTHPLPVKLGEGFVQAALGHASSDTGQGIFLLALKKDGTFWTWGWKWEDEQTDVPVACRKGTQVVLGDSISKWNKPAGATVQLTLRAPAQTAIASLAAGPSHSALVTSDGTLLTWGNNSHGQLADGTTRNRNLPRQVGTGFRQVDIDQQNTLALKQDHTLWCWGCKAAPAQAGPPYAPVQVNGDMLKLVQNGYEYEKGLGRGLGIRRDGTLWDWQYYWTIHNPPGEQAGSDVSEVGVLKYGFSIALRRDGTLWHLQQYPMRPAELIGRNFAHIVSSEDHAYGIKADGSLWAWGENSASQLGDGTRIGQASPEKIGDGFVQVATGRTHGLALKADGTLWAWGDNGHGQLGDGTTTTRDRPVIVGRGFALIAAGDFHNMAVKTDGSVWAWGDNTQGQLGDGTNVSRASPIEISLHAPGPAQGSVCEQEWQNWGELEARAQGKVLEQLALERSPGKTLHQDFLQFISFNTSPGGLRHVREVAEQFRNGARTDIDRAQGALWSCMADNYDKLEGVSDTQGRRPG